MDKEEKELQVKLAKLQTDVQMWLAFSLAIAAVCIGLLIASIQIGLTSVASNLEVAKTVGEYITVIAFFFFAILVFLSFRKMAKFRDEMVDKL